MYRSKFNEETREKILQALRVGASRQTAAAIAGVNKSQVTRWIQRGEKAAHGTTSNEFYEAVLEAEAHPRMRALGVVYKEMPDDPNLAWKFLQAREPGFAAPQQAPAIGAAPQVIILTLDDGRPVLPPPRLVLNEADEPDQPTGT